MRCIIFSVVFLAMLDCSSNRKYTPVTREKEWRLNDELYTKKVKMLNVLLDKAVGTGDDQQYDFYAMENRNHIEQLNLIDVELFFMELRSEEGMRMDGDSLVIKEVEVERLYYKWNYYQSTTRYWYFNYGKTKYLNYSLFLNQFFFITE